MSETITQVDFKAALGGLDFVNSQAFDRNTGLSVCGAQRNGTGEVDFYVTHAINVHPLGLCFTQRLADLNGDGCHKLR